MWRGPLAYGQATAVRTWVMAAILGAAEPLDPTGCPAADGRKPVVEPLAGAGGVVGVAVPVDDGQPHDLPGGVLVGSLRPHPDPPARVAAVDVELPGGQAADGAEHGAGWTVLVEVADHRDPGRAVVEAQRVRPADPTGGATGAAHPGPAEAVD